MLTRIAAVLARLNDHWLGDLIGCLSLFLSVYLALVFAGVMQ